MINFKYLINSGYLLIFFKNKNIYSPISLNRQAISGIFIMLLILMMADFL